jgi:hypothetical protein
MYIEVSVDFTKSITVEHKNRLTLQAGKKTKVHN